MIIGKFSFNPPDCNPDGYPASAESGPALLLGFRAAIVQRGLVTRPAALHPASCLPPASAAIRFDGCPDSSNEEHILGAYITIPLPGGARQAVASATLAEADVAYRREAATTQKVTAEAAALYHSANAALTSWNASRSAADRLTRAADMTARAYQLGEGTLNDLLTARRLAKEAQLAARLSQLEALELRYRLLLDAHKIWDLD